MLRPGCSSTWTFASLRIASTSAGFGYGMTWHSPFWSLASARGIRRDGEDQVVEGGLAGIVLREGAVPDDRVLLVLQQVERPGADRLLVELVRRAGLHHRVGVFLRLDRGEGHGQVSEEGRLGPVRVKRTV